MNPPQVYMCSPSWTLLPPPSHSIPLGRPSAPAPSIQYRALNLDWQLISYMIFYMFLTKLDTYLAYRYFSSDWLIPLIFFYCDYHLESYYTIHQAIWEDHSFLCLMLLNLELKSFFVLKMTTAGYEWCYFLCYMILDSKYYVLCMYYFYVLK